MSKLATSLTLAVAVLAQLGCNDKSTCDHYRHKDFNPMPDKAIKACTNECKKGDKEACRALELWKIRADDAAFWQAGLEADRKYFDCNSKPGSEKRVKCEKDCAGGDAGACLKLGLDHEFGTHRIDIDRTKALAYYSMGCASYDEEHYCGNLAKMYAPDGPKRDFDFDTSGCHRTRAQDEPIEKYAERCAADCWASDACDRFLLMNCLTSQEECEKACAGGDAAYCRQLYLLHRDGQAVPKNPATAETFRSKACELKDEWSCKKGNRIFRKRKPQSLRAFVQPVVEATD